MAPTKTNSKHAAASRRRRRHPLLEWYEKTTGNLVDKMCCCSYTEGQIFDEKDEPVTYEAGIVPPAWAQDVMEEMEPAISPIKSPRKSKSLPMNHAGHLTLCGGDIFKPDLCLYERHVSPGGGAHSVSTETTVSTSTLQTHEEGDSSGVYDEFEYREGPPNLKARNSSCRPVGNKPRRLQRGSGYRHAHSDSHLEQSRDKERHSESPVPMRSVNSGSLPSLPLLGITEGYEV